MEDKLKSFAEKIDRLVAHCDRLESDNKALRESQEDWLKERAKLLQKNDLAKNKIEAMITRLRSLEQN